MVVKVYVGQDEVLAFAIVDGNPVGEEAYFGKDNRDRENYDASLEELPIAVSSRGLKVDSRRTL